MRSVYKVIKSGDEWHAAVDRRGFGTKQDFIPLFFFMYVQILLQGQKAVFTIVEFEFFDIFYSYAAVNGHLELTLLKGRQRFDAISTPNLEVYKFRDRWFIFGHGESSAIVFEAWWILNERAFYCFNVFFNKFESESWPRKNK